MKLSNGTTYILFVTAAASLVYYYSNIKRVESGYFTDPLWITINSAAYIIFFATITGFVVAKLLKIKRH